MIRLTRSETEEVWAWKLMLRPPSRSLRSTEEFAPRLQLLRFCEDFVRRHKSEPQRSPPAAGRVAKLCYYVGGSPRISEAKVDRKSCPRQENLLRAGCLALASIETCTSKTKTLSGNFVCLHLTRPSRSAEASSDGSELQQ